ncbi:MAG: hypothetical protein RR246_02090, partial [Clostridia bacterium]
MKKAFLAALSFAMATIILFGFAGCTEVELETKTVNGITLSVPDDYQEFKDTNGYMVAGSTDSSITISAPVDVTEKTDWTEESLKELYEDTYSNIVFRSITKDVKIDGGTAIYVSFTGINKDKIEFDVRLIIIYTEDNKMYANYVMFKVGSDCSTAKYADDIMK